ncbi:gamma-glutamyl-gamma-aminobutyrate hydrolase family protein [Solicola gregarius]|uniref:Gamma-glutamyl-gamma-aminobutyrate hydrolase family protein n=1 Tax=Solicola gregarius TaxID=2908642 RepID=A0AA46TI30_9ACTN|nr:gamma-glutamyl-gamma-aminobutyrate hydrolase family protein [Solicola gregarius]UYM04913.1 gamma-glutamyl-gamma-aminobutyrate hydrolase family protein [Solicola gregarius]
MTPPLIRVVVPLEIVGASDEVRTLVNRFTVSALRLLANAGAEVGVVDVSAAERLPVESVCAADGVLLLGGGDLDPALYGGDPAAPNLYGVDRRADDYSIAVVRAARRRGVPVLGICRGNQVINVAAGGTLYPDIADPTLHHGVAPEPMFLDETVTLVDRSWVGDLYGTERLVVRSGHHQAIRDVAPGLRAVAWAGDGIVEGVQADDGWCVGVQWHPEDTDGPAEDAETIIKSFVGVCTSR